VSELGTHLASLEKQLKDNNGGKGFIVGSSLSLAGNVCQRQLDTSNHVSLSLLLLTIDLGLWISLQIFPNAEGVIAEHAPLIAAHSKRIAELPALKKYLESRTSRPY
jgi:glutathione S-transferase